MITIAISRRQQGGKPEQKAKGNDAQAQAAKQELPRLSTKIRLIDNPNTKVRAEASVNIAGAYTVHGLRVVEGDKGMFVY